MDVLHFIARKSGLPALHPSGKSRGGQHGFGHPELLRVLRPTRIVTVVKLPPNDPHDDDDDEEDEEDDDEEDEEPAVIREPDDC